MEKKLTGCLAVALAGVMSLSLFNCKSTAFAAEETTDDDDDEEEEVVIHDEEDLRFIDYLKEAFYDVTLETNEEEIEDDEDGEIYVHFTGSSNLIVGEEVIYDCVFDESSMTFEVTLGAQDESELFTTEALIDDKGGLDGEIVIDDEDGEEEVTYNISDYKNDYEFSTLLESAFTETESVSSVNVDTGAVQVSSVRSLLSSLKRRTISLVLSGLIIVAETAEQIKAKSNYKYNQNLTTYKTNGTRFISYQSGYPDFRFGFSNIAERGCTVISVYNLRVKLGIGEPLSETIYKFEKWAIEVAVGFGYLGSNPREVYRYLQREGISYIKCTKLKKFYNEVEDRGSDDYIMSIWKDGKIAIHCFYVRYFDDIQHIKANELYFDYNNRNDFYSDITDIDIETGFYVGYVII